MTCLWDPIVATILGKEIKVFGVSCAKNLHSFDALLLRQCFQAPIYARDKRSVDTFKRSGVHSCRSNDILFMVEPKALATLVGEGKSRILVAPSASDFRNSGESIGTLAEALRNFININKLEHMEIQGIACQPADIKCLAELESFGFRLTGVSDWSHGEPDRSALDLCRGDIIVSQRFHAALLGALVGVAVYTFGVDPKINDLSASIFPGYIKVLGGTGSAKLFTSNDNDVYSNDAERIHKETRKDFSSMIACSVDGKATLLSKVFISLVFCCGNFCQIFSRVVAR